MRGIACLRYLVVLDCEIENRSPSDLDLQAAPNQYTKYTLDAFTRHSSYAMDFLLIATRCLRN